MIIKNLNITNLRAYSQGPFKFQPGMNLLVGINGVGKTTVLDAIRISLSRVLPEITASRSPKQSFEMSDIKIGSNNLQVSCDFEYLEKNFNLLIHKQKETSIENQPGKPREQVTETPDIETINPELSSLFPNAEKLRLQPLAIYFSTKRSLLVDQKPAASSSAGGQAAAFAESLSPNREFNLRIIAQWYKVQQELGAEKPIALRHLAVLTKAVEDFLPDFKNLHVIDIDDIPQLYIDKNGIPLNVRHQLSDGERGVLSMVLDIAKRLSQANPDLEDPLRDGVAIILIDELDLHLHPKWQRTIVENLARVFPKCQFIATSHSPQIIPSLEPERIQLIRDDEIIVPDRTLGMDSNWILNHLMEASDRPDDATEAINLVENLINEGNFSGAREAMADFEKKGFDFPEWAVFEARIARLELIDDTDEAHS